MKIFAVLTGQVVTNTIVADSIENAELATNSKCVEILQDSSVGIGYEYIDNQFIATTKPEIDE